MTHLPFSMIFCHRFLTLETTPCSLGSRFSHMLFLQYRIFLFLHHLLNICEAFPEVSTWAPFLLEDFTNPYSDTVSVTTTHSCYSIVLVYCGCRNKLPQTGWPKTTRFILSQFWRPNVQNQNVGRAELPPETLGENLFPCLFRLPVPSTVPWLMAASVCSIFTLPSPPCACILHPCKVTCDGI